MMTMGPVGWFTLQATAATAAAFAGLRIGRCGARLWKPAAAAATAAMLLWPLIRLFPTYAVEWVDPDIYIFLEVTGIIVPAALLLTIAALHVPRKSERRAVWVLLTICFLYFVRCGLWMVRPPLPSLGDTRFVGTVCMQSTPYTCVAASLVTLLRAHGVYATETEMARLSYTEYNGGTTDSRAVHALYHKLSGKPVEIRYEKMDYRRLRSIPLPCVVSIDWGYFVSHMVPVLAADEQYVMLGDPLTGPRRVSVPDFLNLWRKRAIYLQDHRVSSCIVVNPNHVVR